MIPKQVKDDFLARELDSFDFIKNYSEKDLLEALEEFAPGYKFKRKPFQHQLACFLLGLENPNFYFMMDMGTGKTGLTLNLLQYYKSQGLIDKALIVAPKEQHLYTWAEEVAKDTDLNICVLADTTKGRAELLDTSDADLFVINYPGLMYLATDYIKPKAKERGQQVINHKKIEWLSSKFQALVLDEAQYTKNIQSLNYKICKQLANRMKVKYLLSGTPFNRSPEDFWSQFNIVDNGLTLGPTLGLYRECFFKTKKNRWGGYEHTFISKLEPDLHKMLKNRSIWYAASECQSLPNQVFNKVYVDFNEETDAYYDRLVKEIRANNEDFHIVNNAFIQMRMLTSGFLGFVNDNSEEKIKINFKKNPKMDALLDIIETIPSDAKIIIFNEFVHSGNLICDALDKAGVKHERLYSGTKDVQEVLRTFKNVPSCRALVCNNQSGSEGLNLQHASYIIYYELPLSNITYQQGLKRIHRSGQSSTCFYYHLLVKNSVDERILTNLENGNDRFESIINGI